MVTPVASTVVLLAGLLARAHAAAPAPAPAGARVMILGTYHMHNLGRDVVKSEIRPTLAPERQREIEQLVRDLARWKPTRIAVEVGAAGTGKLSENYKAFLAGTHFLGESEVDQIAFRLGQRLGLAGFCAIDVPGPYPFDAVRQFVDKRGTPGAGARLAQFLSRMGEQQTERDRRFTVGQILAIINDPDRLRWSHWSELAIIDAHAGAEAPGPALVAGWYQRNLRIFANLRRCIDGPADRLLVIYGAGHAPLLNQFVRDSTDLTLEPVQHHLPKPPKFDAHPGVSLSGIYRPAAK
jgi:hypothetical protein